MSYNDRMVRVRSFHRSNDSSHDYSQETEVQLLRQRRHHQDDHRNHEEGVANPYTKIFYNVNNILRKKTI